MNLSYIFAHGDGVLIATFLLLVAMSAVSWYLIFWKAWVLHRERASLAAFRRHYITTPDWPRHHSLGAMEGALSLLIEQCQTTQQVLHHYSAPKQREILGTHLAHALDSVRVSMDKGLTILASVGSSAPFIGLFGTVWGIYGALTDIAAAGNASLTVVAGPMGEALIATAVGLFAAIPAVLAYNGFLRANRLLVQEYRHIAEQLVLYLPVADAASDSLKLVSGE